MTGPGNPRGVERLAEAQARAYEARQRSSEAEIPVPRTVAEGPYVTISRSHGSGGTELAQALAGRLGWDFVDRTLVGELSRQLNVDAAEVVRHDERPHRALDDYLSHLFLPEDKGQAAYLQAMTRILVEHARRGRAVILGRGANWLLDPAGGVRVRVIAPREKRVSFLMARENLARAAAEEAIHAHDEQQRAFVRQVYRRDVDDPLGYDLVLNLGSIDLDEAAQIVIAALAARSRG